jgi:hypothetical protein
MTMERSWLWLIIISMFALSFETAKAADQDNAADAANSILQSIHDHQYENLWNTQTSEFFKKLTTRDSFVANLSLGMQRLGAVNDYKLIDMSYSQNDPATGFTGEIYAFTYLTSYSAGKFYERVVVVKEGDGEFRLSGLWGSPASQ